MFKNIKTGISPLTWTNDDMPELGGEIPFEQCIAEMALAGYEGCEIGNKFPTDSDLLLKSLQAHHLTIASQWCSLHFTVSGRKAQTLERFKKQLNFLKSVGATMINVVEKGGSIQGKNIPILGDRKPVFSAQQWQDLFLGLNEVGQIAQDHGMGVSYHQHMGTGVQNFSELELLMNGTNPDLIGFLLDTGHIVYAGMDLLEIVQRYARRINHVHLKDIRLELMEQVQKQKWSFLESVRAGIFTVPGDGGIDFKSVFEVLSLQQYQGWFLVEAEQDPGKADPLTYAKLGREYIRTMIGQ